MTDSGLLQDSADHHHKLLRHQQQITTLESQVAELTTTLDTLTDKLIEAGVLVKRKEE